MAASISVLMLSYCLERLRMGITVQAPMSDMCQIRHRLDKNGYHLELACLGVNSSAMGTFNRLGMGTFFGKTCVIKSQGFSALALPPGKLQGITIYYRKIGNMTINNGSSLNKRKFPDTDTGSHGCIRP